MTALCGLSVAILGRVNRATRCRAKFVGHDADFMLQRIDREGLGRQAHALMQTLAEDDVAWRRSV